jgi:hypothetical protein
MSDEEIKNLERRLALETKARKNIAVQGGNNVLVSSFGDKIVVDSLLEEPAVQRCTNWDVVFVGKTTGDNPKGTLTVPNGMINGLLPENREDVGTVSKDDEANWLSLEVQLKDHNVESAEFRVGTSKPDTLFDLQKELPTDVSILIAFIGRNFAVQKFTGCGHIRIYPKIAYYAYDDSERAVIPYYTHEMYYA